MKKNRPKTAIKPAKEQITAPTIADTKCIAYTTYMPWIVASLIVILTILFYLPVMKNGFVNWDDAEAIIENLHIRTLTVASLQWMFTSFLTGNWIPLTWFSFTLDYMVGGLNAAVYHGHNLILHAINSVLVFFLCLNLLKVVNISTHQIKRRGIVTPEVVAAALASLLFALHPIHVESVAWVTERKDLLCGMFFFASLLVYLDFASSGRQKTWKWWVCLGLFALALLAKPMAITLPLVLLLIDAWLVYMPLEPGIKREPIKIPNILWEKIPFFMLSIVFAGITLAAQSHAGAVVDIVTLSLDFRLMNAFHSLVFYIGKMVLPLDLVPFYPIGHQGFESFSAVNIFAFLVVACISVICFFYRKSRPYLAICWLYYVITLLPVLGILQVGGQAAADRYSYIPSVSLLLLFSTAVITLLYSHRLILTGLSLALITILGFVTIQQIAFWRDSITLWESVVKVYPNVSMMVHTNLAQAYKQFGRAEESIREYDRALAFQKPHHYMYDGKGAMLFNMGYVDEAIQNFHLAIALDPTYASPHRNLWFAYDKKGLDELALAEILEAIRINPEYAAAYSNLGISYGRKAQYDDSIKAFEKALALDSYNADYLVNLATTYQRLGQLDKAIDLYKKGIEQNAKASIYYLNLGNTYLLKGMVAEAIAIWQKGTTIQPPDPVIFQKLGVAYEKWGENELAAYNYRIAKSLKGIE